MELFPCPCCGYLMFSEPPGSYEICEICFWEDDPVQLRFPDMQRGANHVSLIQAQRNYAAFGACEYSMREHVRLPQPGEVRDVLWRPIDLDIDNFQKPEKQTTYFELATDESTKNEELYYWLGKK